MVVFFFQNIKDETFVCNFDIKKVPDCRFS